jgi:hypothetical protein
MDLVVNSRDELIAAVPHVVGFEPDESVVLVPTYSQRLPAARVDLPLTADERATVLAKLRGPIDRYGQPGDAMAVICFTEDGHGAELASRHLADGLDALGVRTPLRLWATDERWVDLDTGQAGGRTQEAATRITAEAVATGARRPAASREALADSLRGDRGPVAALLPFAQVIAKEAPDFEREWTQERLEQFHADGHRLSDIDATRILLAVQKTTCRDAMWDDMNADNIASHMTLWTDLTRRAPDEVRAPAASLLAFSSWLNRDGATAWCAIDQVPPEPPYTIARIVASALDEGVDPQVWDDNRDVIRALAGHVDESYVPQPPGHRHHANAPAPGPARPGPAPPR